MNTSSSFNSPDHICMTMLNISTVGLDLKGARPLQRELKVNILSHLHLLIEQRCLTLLGQAAACILQTADDPRRALQHSLHASEWPPILLCLTKCIQSPAGREACGEKQAHSQNMFSVQCTMLSSIYHMHLRCIGKVTNQQYSNKCAALQTEQQQMCSLTSGHMQQ